MKINPINNQDFKGNVIVKNAISTQQNYLFNLHKPALERMIKNMPFDLFVEQSKSKKTITLSTNVKGAYSYAVRKNEQNYEETAGLAISDAMKKSEILQKNIKANVILEYVKSHMINVISGKFKEAKEARKKIAQLAIENFDIYKEVTNFKITDIPPQIGKVLFINSLKYKFYNAFSSKTPEEKQLIKMNKEYLKEMKAQNKKIEPKEIKFSMFY